MKTNKTNASSHVLVQKTKYLPNPNADQHFDLKDQRGSERFETLNYSNTDFKHITRTPQFARIFLSILQNDPYHQLTAIREAFTESLSVCLPYAQCSRTQTE